jgi:hypothetical protein
MGKQSPRNEKYKNNIPKPGEKTLKLNFHTGNFDIVKNVIEFVSGPQYLFIAYIPPGGFPTAMIHERNKLESVDIRDKKGKFKTVKLRKAQRLGDWRIKKSGNLNEQDN